MSIPLRESNSVTMTPSKKRSRPAWEWGFSGVMVRDQLLRTLLQVVLEEGGARRARLVLRREGELQVVAEAAVGEATVGEATVGEVKPPPAADPTPVSVSLGQAAAIAAIVPSMSEVTSELTRLMADASALRDQLTALTAFLEAGAR